MDVRLSQHFKLRVDERFNSNNYNKEGYILETFKKIYKDYRKGKIFPKIEKTSNQYGETYKLYYQEFKYVFSKETGIITLITFGIRCKN